MENKKELSSLIKENVLQINKMLLDAKKLGLLVTFEAPFNSPCDELKCEIFEKVNF